MRYDGNLALKDYNPLEDSTEEVRLDELGYPIRGGFAATVLESMYGEPPEHEPERMPTKAEFAGFFRRHKTTASALLLPTMVIVANLLAALAGAQLALDFLRGSVLLMAGLNFYWIWF